MGFFLKWFERIKGLVLARRQDSEAVDEIAFHLDMEIRAGIERGLSPEAARREALLAFGGVERFREEVRQVRWGTRFHDAARDLRNAARALIRRPGYSMLVVGTLALGIGSATALFNVVQGVLLRPLPYAASGELLRVENSWTGSPQGRLSPAEHVDLRDWLSEWEGFGSYTYGSMTLSGDGPPERYQTAFVSAGVLEALAVVPALGRVITTTEDHADAPVVMLTDAFWRTRFGGESDVIGRNVQINGSGVEVIGVFPPDFRMPEDLTGPVATQLVMPLGIDPATEPRQQRGNHYLLGIARLPHGLSIADGSRTLEALGARMVELYPNGYPAGMDFQTRGVALLDDLVGPVRPMLLLLLASVGLAFLIVCANVANLLLVRVSSRSREFALRRALGAGRRRIVLQVLGESFVLAVCGGLLGVLVATLVTQLLVAIMPVNMPRLTEVSLSGWVLGFSVALGLAAGLLFSAAPALNAGREDSAQRLKGGARSSGGLGASRLQQWLVTGQIAAAVFLTAGAALVTRSFIELTSVDPGFRTEQVLSGRIGLPSTRYPSSEEVNQFFASLLEEISALPGVVSAGAVTNLPLATRLGDLGFELEEARVPEGQDKPDSDWQVVTAGYFEAMGVDVLSGRGIASEDRSDSRGVVVVNETMATAYWPNQSPIGRRIRLGGENTQPRWAEVVGVVDDVRHGSLDQPPRPQMYLANTQFRHWSSGSALRSLTLVMHTTLGTAELQRVLRDRLVQRDPNLALYDVRTIEEAFQNSVARPRFTSLLLVGFSGLAVILAMLGVYGVMAYAVRGRTKELGIRVALGATPTTLIRGVLRDGLMMSLLGAGFGLAAILASSVALERFLFGVRATDPLTLGATVLAVTAAALLACYGPARTASQADAIVALGSD